MFQFDTDKQNIICGLDGGRRGETGKRDRGYVGTKLGIAHFHTIIARHSIRQEDRVTYGKGSNLLAAHGIDLQGGKVVITHGKLHLGSGTHCREVQHFTNRVRRGTHTECVRNIGLTTRTVRDIDGDVITTAFREEIVHCTTTQRVNLIPAHIPMERAVGIILVITVVVIRKLAMRHKVNHVVRAYIKIQIAVFLQMGIFAARCSIEYHIDTLTGAHAVGGDGKASTFARAICLETDGQTS